MTLKWNLEWQKLDKRNKGTSKKLGHEAMSERCDVIVFFSIYFFSKISYTALILLLWVKVAFLPKNVNFLQKNAGVSKIKEVLLLKDTFSETIYVCVLTYQISSFCHNSNEF